MAAFSYQAIDKAGKKVKGVLEADSDKQLRRLLREKQLTPLFVEPIKQKSKTHVKVAKLKHAELTLLTRQLATLISAGKPLEEALAALAAQYETSRVKGIVLAVRAKVLEGHSLGHALSQFPHSFSELFCATITAGEQTGHLDQVLERLADYIESQQQIRQKLLHALIYPAIMIFVSVTIVGFLLVYVVPKMIGVFHTLGQALPPLTLVLIAISNWLKHYILWLIGLLIIAAYGFAYLLRRSRSLRLSWHYFLLKVPLIKRGLLLANTARFLRTFGILLNAGVPVLQAMKISAELITCIPIQNAIFQATQKVSEGASINLALQQTRYVPLMSVQLIASGESSGQLETMLERAADNQEKVISQFIDTSLRLFEPLLILIMGGVVLFIVLAVLLPIFSLDQMTG